MTAEYSEGMTQTQSPGKPQTGMAGLDAAAASDAKLHRLSHLARLADDWDLFAAVDNEINTRTWDRLTAGC